MTLKFIKNVTKEGERKVINIPKKYHKEVEVGEKVLVSKLDYEKMSKEELKEIIEND